jgi:general secretion pathway protein G
MSIRTICGEIKRTAAACLVYLSPLAGRGRIASAIRVRGAATAGFTLVEVLVVITIIALIMGLIGPRVLNYLTESKAKAAKIQIESLASALDLYFLDAGRYPNTSEGLSALIQHPGGTNGWNGPYLRGNAVPNDPWGRPYVYRAPGQHGPYDIISYGADGQEGGTGAGADISSWAQ